MKKLDKNSLDVVKQNIEKLKEIFPDVFTEDKIDFEKLRENLGEFVDESDEKYQFTWFGKKKANQLALTPTKATLRPAKNESKNWETTKNIYIEGDNLEVLKVLQKAYYKKIKMIYIDPPYNTGKDFIYKDNYKDNLKNYLALTGQVDEEGNPLTTNTETSGRKHSNWLNMIYPRLKLARNLLKDDGVIFVSIDDNEVHNLRKIMDEIFGEENFVGEIVRKTKSMTADKKTGFNLQHESLLVYARNLDNIFLKGEEKDYKDYKNPDNDPNGEWVSGDPTAKSGNESLRFKIINPYTGQVDLPPKGRYWAFSKETFTKYVEAGKIKFKKEKKENERGFIFKRYKKELKSEHNSVNSLFAIENDYMNQKATKELKEMFDNEFFENPKPVKFIKKLIKYSTSTSDLILDFFSGSATTAHAVMELNAEDGGNRQFILVQLSEPIDEKSEAYKAGYKNICEIGKERIRRAGEKIKEDYKDKELIDNLDIGFKVFKLDSTNIKEWDSNPDNLEKSLLDYEEFIKEDRSEEDLLYEILLKYGIDLTAPIEEKEINGKKVYIVGFGSFIIYFDEIDIKIAKEIIDLVKNYESDFTVLVLKDDSFATSQDKVNIVEFFKQMNLFEKIITL
jgi:adenine-specific DNA-methyltransferase